jgi:Tfp pilus assembly protein PilV
MTAARPAPRTGLSLLEVLLSLTIFLIALGAIVSLVDHGSNRSADAALQTTATRLAQSKLAEVEAGAVSLTASSSDTFPVEPEWTWSVEPGTPPAPNLYPVTVRVSRQYGGRLFEFSLTQMVFDPAQMGKAAPAQAAATAGATGSSSGTGTGTTGGGS